MNFNNTRISVISLLYRFDISCLDSYYSLYHQVGIEFEHLIIYKNLEKNEIEL